MNTSSGVKILEIIANVGGEATTIYPTLIFDDKSIILVDAGYPDQLSLISEKIIQAGLDYRKISKIIITHQDIDHIGSLQAFVEELPQKVEVLAHEEERPYLEGYKVPLRLAALQAQLPNASQEVQDYYKHYKSVYDSLKIQIEKSLIDGEELPYCGGIVIIHTPGHTPGHICLYAKKHKILIAGDAMSVVAGQLSGPNIVYTLDMEVALASLKKLKNYDIEKVICYHGGLFTDKPNKRIAQLAENRHPQRED